MATTKTMLFCLVPVLASAHIDHVQSAGTVGGLLTVTPKHKGDLLVVFAGSSDSEGILSISDTAGNIWIALNPAISQSGKGSARSWYAISRGAASTSIIVRANAGWQNILLDEFSGVNQSNPVDKARQKKGSGTALSGGLIPDTSKELVWAGVLGTITGVGSGYTKGADDYSQDWSEYRILRGGIGAAHIATFRNSGTYICLAASFRPAGSVVSPPAIQSFTASPPVISAGQSSTLSWTSNWGTSATLDGAPVAVSHNQIVSPSESTMYTLVVTNAAGSVFSRVKVAVNAWGTYSISGKVSGSAATLTLSGPASGQTETDSSANYSFEGLVNGVYLIAPSESGYSFSPPAALASVNGANVGAVDFIALVIPPPPPHSASLSWTASTSANISGYNVYRGTASGGPYTRINGSLVTATTYLDNSVSAGQTYYYVATAVDSSNVESGYSNEAEAVVPSP